MISFGEGNKKAPEITIPGLWAESCQLLERDINKNRKLVKIFLLRRMPIKVFEHLIERVLLVN